MHIAWLGKKSPFCGNVTYGREITNALLERGNRVTFLHFDQSSHGHHCDSLSERSEEVSIPFLFKSQILTIPSLKSGKLLADALKRLQPDIVHASLTLSPLDFRLPEICADLNLPLVATFHPAFDRRVRSITSGTQHLTYQLYAPCLAHYDRVIVFSDLQRDLLIKLGVPAATLAVIPNGVDIRRYSPGPSAVKADLYARRLFIYQGRISPEKNVEALLRGWRQADMGPGCKLAIVGGGPLEASLKRFYDDDDIIWLGYLASEQRRIDILRAADGFILPSFVEGLSLSLLEAMACGTACIATDAGADGEVLAEGAGIVLDTQRVSSQLQTILPILRDHPEITQLLGKKAQERVLQRYTLRNNISALEVLYGQVTAEQRLVCGQRA
ncbi:MAG: glycosyltransferase [Shackletoniella antarctica]|jgi:glycosyltransferase involved in cell wall biosynthesis|uniref:Glycosyltransferase n=1 Tax=Shackletoniella antarctica TaxID=268115 RepID=A0A2W4WHL5_9CYAN|nr:MAG: glycosyltransferase [Shackletoniella antarctica]